MQCGFSFRFFICANPFKCTIVCPGQKLILLVKCIQFQCCFCVYLFVVLFDFLHKKDIHGNWIHWKRLLSEISSRLFNKTREEEVSQQSQQLICITNRGFTSEVFPLNQSVRIRTRIDPKRSCHTYQKYLKQL